MTGLSVPDIDPEGDCLVAALAYAKCGWYVIPVKRGSKHPGSVLGFAWNEQSSREPDVIVSWFAGTDYGIALHCGRSGAVVLDVDNPENMPDWLSRCLGEAGAPFQKTRNNKLGAGHHIFAQPKARVLGNGTGKLGGEWGEVRGANGVIIVSPSVHEKQADGGYYEWLHTGPVPALPEAIADRLHDATPGADAATDAACAAFLVTHHAGDDLPLVRAWVATFNRAVLAGESRHGKALSILTGALKEAKAGLFPALTVAQALREAFLVAVAADGTGKQGKGRSGAAAVSEWKGILAWAVAQAQVADDDLTMQRLAENTPGAMPGWVKGQESPPRPLVESVRDEGARGRPDGEGAPTVSVPRPLGGLFGTGAAVAALKDAVHPHPEHEPQTEREPTQQADDPHAPEAMSPATAMELVRLRAVAEAKALLEAERFTSSFRAPDYLPTLAHELALPDEDVAYRIDSVLPIDGNALLTAQYKTGKTTFIINLTRALADGTPFLGRLGVAPLNGRRVAVWNYEVSRGQFRRWLRESGIDHPERVAVLNLRGHVLPITNPDVQDWCVRWLVEHEVGIWEVDPFARAFTGQSENDNTEVGRWLDALDVIKNRAEVSEMVLATHTGRAEMEAGAERARGATRLNDWCDVQLVLTKDKDKRRYFSASGRDVEFEECALNYDSDKRQMTLGEGNRRGVQKDDIKTQVFIAVEHSLSALKTGDVVAKVGKRQADVSAALAELVAEGRIAVRKTGVTNWYSKGRPTPFGTLPSGAE